MVIHTMKTTLNIDDSVMQWLREEAVRRSTTMSALVDAALRRALDEAADRQERRVMPTLPTWKGGPFLVDVANRDELYRVTEEEA